jgi:glycosyltransferase involved in cell wall biosynthesis
MKILFPIGTLFPSQAGGPSNTMYWIAKALTQLGATVTLVTTDAGTNNQVTPDQWLKTDFGKVIYCHDTSAQLPLRMLMKAIFQVGRHDCIHLNSLFFPPSFLLAALAIWKKKPVLWSCRGNLHPEALTYGRWKKRPALWLIRSFLSGKLVTFHATSREEYDHIRNILGLSVQIVELPNYMELPEVQPHDDQTSRYLLFVGRLHPIKALDQLIAALNLSNSFKQTGCILKIAGSGDAAYIDQIKSQIEQLGLQNHIQWLGMVEGYEKQALFAQAYCTILPSHSENFGNVVVESLAQGTPVIASTGTPWQSLEEQTAGFWSSSNPPEMAQTIDRMLMLDSAVYQGFRNNALNMARQCFDIRQNIGAYMELYNKMIG